MPTIAPASLVRTTLRSLGIVLLLAAAARADTVKLANGDVLTGTVQGLEDGKLVLDTEYAGVIQIDPAHVSGIETDEPFTVRWDDGSEKVGRLEVTAPGRIEVVSAPAPPAAAPGEDAAVETAAAEPDLSLEEAREAAAEATESAIEAAADDGEQAPVAAETGAVNLESVAWIRPIAPYYRYEGNFNLGLNMARGNTETTDLHIDGQIAPSFGRNTIRLGGQLNQSDAQGVTTASNWRIAAEYDREFGVRRRWYGTVFNSYENDELADLNLRVTAGAGIGYKFFDEKPTLLRIALGPAYVNEDYKTDLDRTFLGLRWNLDFSQDLWSDDVVLYHSDTATFGLSEEQFVVLTSTGVRVALIGNLSLSAEYQYNWNAEPPPGAKEADRRFILKIGYAFKGDENDWWQGW